MQRPAPDYCSKPPPTLAYELPDGNTVRIRTPRQLVPELHFRPEQTDGMRHLLVQRQTPTWTSLQQSQSVTMRQTVALTQSTTVTVPVPLPGMIYNALLNCTPESRRDLCNHGMDMACACVLRTTFLGAAY